MDTSPASLLLVHGAGSGPWIFRDWDESFPGLQVAAVDLQTGLDVAHASMDDYAAQVTATAGDLPQPVALSGWSMGGLVAMLATLGLKPPPHSLVLIEPSPPQEIQGFRRGIDLAAAAGAFDPEAVYGAFPNGTRSRPESALARTERQRGISIPRLPCPSLVIYGDEFPDQRGRKIAERYGSQQCAFPGLDHWGLIRDPRVREAIGSFVIREGR
jgi:pimeloyl-ACP methyl ester carboxylesterase